MLQWRCHSIRHQQPSLELASVAGNWGAERDPRSYGEPGRFVGLWRSGTKLHVAALRSGPTCQKVVASTTLATMIRVISDARALREMGGVRFTVTLEGVERDAFAVRWRGTVHAYVNTCRHQSLALDFGDAHFFDEAADALVCCHHGARYRPDSGECFAGPCQGARLTKLRVVEKDGAIWCEPAKSRGG